ncbi:MAG: hypothetical protein WBA10_07525, partial [Elainellaceae cyanobacterium]
MPYPVPPPPPLVQVADVSYTDTLAWPDTGSSAQAESQVLLPEPMQPRPVEAVVSTLLMQQPPTVAGRDRTDILLQPTPQLLSSQPLPSQPLTGAAATESRLGPAMEVGLPNGGSLPGSHFGDLQQAYDLDEDKARSLESEARSRLGHDEAAYEETTRLLHESRNILSELVDWVAQQPEVQGMPPSDTSQDAPPNAPS